MSSHFHSRLMQYLPKALKVAVVCASLLVTACKASEPSIQTWNTQNGVRVLFKQTSQIPMLDVRVVFAAGSGRDGMQYGLAQLTASSLHDGAGPLNVDDLADAFANVGAQYGANIDQDMAVFSLRTLTQAQYLQPAIKTFNLILTQPNFPAADIAREQNQQLIGLQMAMQDPATIAQMKFLQAMYGNSPYGHLPIGQPDTLAKIHPQDVVNFYHRYYVASNAFIVLVGNISQAQAKTIANEISQGLAAGQAAPAIEAAPFTAKGQVIKVPFNSEQTTIIEGEPATKVGDPLFYALTLGNYSLGGGDLVSRLFVQVRSQAGLAYSVTSNFMPQQAPGPFVIMAQTRNAQAQAAVQKMNQVLQDYVASGPTQAELDAAKQNLIGGFPLLIAGNGNMADVLTIIGFYHLPLNYLDTYRQNLQKVSLQQVDQALKQTLHPNNMLTVMVGGSS